MKHLINIFIFLLATITISAQTSEKFKDSIQVVINNLSSDNLKVLEYYKLSEAYFNVPDSSLKYIKRGLRLSRSNKYIEKEHQGLNLLAQHWYYRGANDSALHAIKLALNIKGSYSTPEKIKSFNNQGRILHALSNHQEATSAHLEALELAEKINDSNSIVIASVNLGNIYRYLGEQNKAFEIYKQAIEISKKIGNKKYIASCYGNLALVYRATNQPEKALDAYEKSLKMHRAMGEKFHIAIGLQNLGVFYESLGEWDKSKKCHLESYKISNEIDDNIGVILSSINLATIESKTKNYNKAITLLDNALVEANKIDYAEALKHIYLAYAETYSRTGNYKEAYVNQKKYEKWKDSVSSKEYLQKVNELETKYETEKKDKDILTLTSEKLKSETAIAKQQARIKFLTIGLVALAILFTGGFIIFKQRIKNKKQKELIAAITETQIEERKRIAQDLHDGVGGTLALAKNKLETLLSSEKEKSKEVSEFMETLSDTANQIRQISHNMMPGELVKFGLVSAIKTTLDQIENEDLKTHLYTHNLDDRIDQTKEIHTFRIIQEIIQNVLKHANAKTLNVHLNRHPKILNLLVEDDGIGFAYNAATTNGLGLKNIKSRVHYLNGKFHVDSASGKGTTFNIEIPL